MLLRGFWGDYMVHKETRFASLDEYAAYRVRKDWNMSMQEAIDKTWAEMQKNLIPYDKQRFGPLPELLKDA